MRYIRYKKGYDVEKFGWINDDKVGAVEGVPYGEYRRLEAVLDMEAVRLLAPVLPGKIICVGRNYADHAREHGAEVPEIPIIFLKPPSAVIGPGADIILPIQSQQVDHEAELGIVIGKPGWRIQPDEARAHIFGYLAANDVTARDLQRSDGQWTRAKGFDTFCPLGPWIETDFDPSDALITCRVNGDLRQMASSREMVFNIYDLIAFISSVMTLYPGDVILTGTPAGVSPLKAGDIVSVNIDGIGELVNTVKSIVV